MWGTKPHILYYKEDDNTLLLPVGFRDALLDFLNRQNIEYILTADKVKSKKNITIESTIALRDYQIPLFAEMIHNDRGIIHLSTGGGKTILALQYAYFTGGKTTVIVKDKNLLHQFAEECKKFLGVMPALIGDGNKEIGDITIATIQTLGADSDLLATLVMQTETLIVDEIQTMVTVKRRAVLDTFKATNMFGLTATPFRSKDDMQTDAIGFVFGKILASHEIETMKPTVHVYPTDALVPVLPNYHDMIERMIHHEERNNFICGIAGAEILSGHKVLILTKRVAHAELLYEKLQQIDGVYHIQADTKDKKTLLADMKNGKEKFTCIIGTLQLLGTGFDIPALDRLLLVGDMKSNVLTVQTTGRILRILEGKDPIIYDFVDHKNGMLKNQYMQRKKIYKEKGWPIEYHPYFMEKWL